MIGLNKKFTDFINDLENIADNSSKPWEKYGAYNLKRFISDKDGNTLVDHVFKLEDINTEFIIKMSELGINKKNINHLNKKTSENEYRQYYDKYTRNKVAEIYKYEIEKFKYTF